MDAGLLLLLLLDRGTAADATVAPNAAAAADTGLRTGIRAIGKAAACAARALLPLAIRCILTAAASCGVLMSRFRSSRRASLRKVSVAVAGPTHDARFLERGGGACGSVAAAPPLRDAEEEEGGTASTGADERRIGGRFTRGAAADTPPSAAP